jgi:hypothetical protein
MADAEPLSDPCRASVVYLGWRAGGLGMIGARGSVLGTVTCSVGGLGAGLVDPIVPSLRAGAAHIRRMHGKRVILASCAIARKKR